MSWTIALQVASIAITAFQQSKQAEAESFVDTRQAQVSNEESLAAQVEAQQKEVKSRKAFEALQATARYSAGYDPYGSASFQAIRAENLRSRDDDIRALEYQGAATHKHLQLETEGHMLNSEAARRTGQMGLAKGAADIGGTLLRNVKPGMPTAPAASTWTGPTNIPSGPTPY